MHITLNPILALLLLGGPSHASSSSHLPPPFPTITATAGEQLAFAFPAIRKYTLSGDCGRILPPSRVPTFESPISKPQGGAPESSPQASQLIFKAIQPGFCTLIVWGDIPLPAVRNLEIRPAVALSNKRTGRLSELPPPDAENSSLPRNLLLALSSLPELSVSEAGPEKLVVQGSLHSKSVQKLSGIITSFGRWLELRVQLPDALLLEWKREIEQTLASRSLSHRIHLTVENGELRISGALADPEQLAGLSRALQDKSPLIHWEVQTLPEHSEVISLRAFLIESREHLGSTLGILPLPGDAGISLQWSPLGMDASTALIPRIRALEKDGKIQILSEPQVSLRCPGEATLFAGGEIPIRHHTPGYSQTQWKNFGLQLQIHALASTSEAVRLEVLVENSQLDPSLTPPGETPGLLANRMKSQIDASFSVPLILSGLKMHEKKRTKEGWKWLRDIPLLGLLFGSEESTQTDTTISAILIPERGAPHPSPTVLPQLGNLNPHLESSHLPQSLELPAVHSQNRTDRPSPPVQQINSFDAAEDLQFGIDDLDFAELQLP
jgi:hypothetical protein